MGRSSGPISTRSRAPKLFCLLCNNENVTLEDGVVSGRKRSNDLTEVLFECLSIDLDDIRGSLEDVALCFKCKYAVEEWEYANEQSGSGFLANRARQLKATLTEKILRSFGSGKVQASCSRFCRSSTSSGSAVDEIREIIYNRYNVRVNVERLGHDDQEEDTEIVVQSVPMETASDFDDDDGEVSAGGSGSDSPNAYAATHSKKSVSKATSRFQDSEDVEANSDDDDDFKPEEDSDDSNFLVKTGKTNPGGRKDHKSPKNKSSVTSNRQSSHKSHKTVVAIKERSRPGPKPKCVQEEAKEKEDKFKHSHPIPADFSPTEPNSTRYDYGQCSANIQDDGSYKCSACDFTVSESENSEKLPPLWQMRDHMRHHHPDLIPRVWRSVVECIGPGLVRYGKAVAKITETDEGRRSYLCLHCKKEGALIQKKYQGFKQHVVSKVSGHPELAAPRVQERDWKYLTQLGPTLFRIGACLLTREEDFDLFTCQVCDKSSLSNTQMYHHVYRNHADFILPDHSTNKPPHPDKGKGGTIGKLMKLDLYTTQESWSTCLKFPALLYKPTTDKLQPEMAAKRAQLDTKLAVAIETARSLPLGYDYASFKQRHPIPGDLKDFSGECWAYGRCRVSAKEGSYCCSQCDFTCPTDQDLALWTVREHMRAAHKDLGPSADEIGPTDTAYGACPLSVNSGEFTCKACPVGGPWKDPLAADKLVTHVVICHPELAPVVSGGELRLIHLHPEVTPGKHLFYCKIPFQAAPDLDDFTCGLCLKHERNFKQFASHIKAEHLEGGRASAVTEHFEVIDGAADNNDNSDSESDSDESVQQLGDDNYEADPVRARQGDSPVKSRPKSQKSIKTTTVEKLQQYLAGRRNSNFGNATDRAALKSKDFARKEYQSRKSANDHAPDGATDDNYDNHDAEDFRHASDASASVDNEEHPRAGSRELSSHEDPTEKRKLRERGEEQYKQKHPVPPDFNPTKPNLSRYDYGDCSTIRQDDGSFKCSACDFDVSESESSKEPPPLWRMRDHMRQSHPDLLPFIWKALTEVIGPGLIRVGKCAGKISGTGGSGGEGRRKFLCLECKKEAPLLHKSYNSFKEHVFNRSTGHPELAPPGPKERNYKYLTQLGPTLFRIGACLFTQEKRGAIAVCKVCGASTQWINKHLQYWHPGLLPPDSGAGRTVKLDLQTVQESWSGLLQFPALIFMPESETSTAPRKKSPDNRLMVAIETTRSLPLGYNYTSFKQKHPIPLDFRLGHLNSEHYSYGRCGVSAKDDSFRCDQCGFPFPKDQDSVLWAIREHMRAAHKDLVPSTIDVKEPTETGYGACPVSVKNGAFTCGACSLGGSWKNPCAADKLVAHVVICHPELAPLVGGNLRWIHPHPQVTPGKHLFDCKVLFKATRELDDLICGLCFMHIPDFKQLSAHIKTAHTSGGSRREIPMNSSNEIVPQDSQVAKVIDLADADDTEGSNAGSNDAASFWEADHEDDGPNPEWPVKTNSKSAQKAVQIPLGQKMLMDRKRTVEAQRKLKQNQADKFKRDHPIPPDFSPTEPNSSRYQYGKCSAELQDDGAYKCSACEFQVGGSEGSEKLPSLWQMRDHMRQCHSDLIPYVQKYQVEVIGPHLVRYGKVAATIIELGGGSRNYFCLECKKVAPLDRDCYAKFRRHVRKGHPGLAPVNKEERLCKALIRLSPTLSQVGACLFTNEEGDLDWFVCKVCGTSRRSPQNHVRTMHSDLAPLERSPKDVPPAEPQSSNTCNAQAPVTENSTDTPPHDSQVVPSRPPDSQIAEFTPSSTIWSFLQLPALLFMPTETEQSAAARAKEQLELTDPLMIAMEIARSLPLGYSYASFKQTHPIPADFRREASNSERYSYGRCKFSAKEDSYACHHCDFRFVKDQESALWAIREHMRTAHKDLVPSTDTFGPTETAYGACPLTVKDGTYTCNACILGGPWKDPCPADKLVVHVVICHPELAPVVGGDIRWTHLHPEVTPGKHLFVCKVLFEASPTLDDFTCGLCFKHEPNFKQLAAHINATHSPEGSSTAVTSNSNLNTPGNAEAIIDLANSSDDDDTADPSHRSPATALPLLRNLLQERNNPRSNLTNQLAQQQGEVRIGRPIGRPRKHPKPELSEQSYSRPRGRPRKHAEAEEIVEDCKRPRGRPRKHPKPEEIPEDCKRRRRRRGKDGQLIEQYRPYIPKVRVEGGFQCPLCGQLRPNKPTFVLHLKWHAGDIENEEFSGNNNNNNEANAVNGVELENTNLPSILEIAGSH